jgi:hypothetical protein
MALAGRAGNVAPETHVSQGCPCGQRPHKEAGKVQSDEEWCLASILCWH